MGLIGGIARTAVIAGTATAVSNRVSRRQAERWAQEDQSAYAQQPAPPPPQYAQPAPPPPAAAPPAADDPYEQIRKLAELKDAGILTDEEFAKKKAQLLGL